MELRHLKYFVMVAKTLSFSEASKRLFITQGTLSQQIQQLEAEMGVQLFDRTRHSVALTEAGEELLPLAIQTIEDSEACSNRMRELKGALVGTLRIGVTYPFGELLAETVRKFIRKHPGVKLNIISRTAAELMDMLSDKELDLVLAYQPSVAVEGIESELLFKSILSVVMRKDHPLATKKHLTLKDLEQYRTIIPSQSLQSRSVFDRYLGLDTRGLNVTVEINDPNLIMDIVQNSNMITVISSLAAYYRTSLVAIPLEGGSYPMTGCVHRLKDGYRKRSADIFIEMLHDSAIVERICKSLN